MAENPPGYPPPQGAYPPPQGAHPPPQGAYPPPQAGGYPPPQAGGYPPPQGGYPPPQGGYQQPPPAGVQPGVQFMGTNQPGYMPPPAGQPPPGQVQVQWMQKPAGLPGCPPGLEYLTQIDQLLVHQQVELLEAFVNWETKNKYQVKNSMGQQVYFAAEESDVCMRQCCGPGRGFTMHITDNFQQEVIRVVREFKCCAGVNCCAFSDCCAMEVSIEAPVGQVVGYIKQTCSFLAPKYEVKDAQGTTVLTIEGPVCICQGPCCTWDQEFKVQSLEGAEVGKISKQWSGLVREMFTDADNFGVSFPVDLDVKIKATLLGAVFLIDFMFFENKNNNNN